MTPENNGNIDELLMGQKTNTQPQAPEYQADEAPDTEGVIEVSANEQISAAPSVLPEDANDYGVEESKSAPEVDEYGNERAASKVYTEDEVNERINAAVRDRLARVERNTGQQPNQQQVQQAAATGFEYNSDSNESWQQQLESFVEQTVSRMSHKQAQQEHQQREMAAQAEFEEKFRSGMDRFSDFTQVVGQHRLSDAMVVATRSMKDPAAFVYAAAKRAPQELQRIANISDPYAQIAEMGKLEERMKKTKPATTAPRPVGRTQEDLGIPHKSDKQPTIEEMIAQSNAKRMAQLKQRRK